MIHIHPFSQLGVGANATLAVPQGRPRRGRLDLSLSDTKLDYLGETYEEGKTKCEGVEDPVLRVAYWANVQDAASKPEVTTGDFDDLRLTENGGGITIFYGDPDADIPKPPNAAKLAELGAADGGQTPDAQRQHHHDDGADATTTSTTGGRRTTTTTAAAGQTTTTAAP